MSVKFRITLLSTFWLLLILIFFNSFIYAYFEKITTQSEIDLLLNKAESVMQNINESSDWSDPALLNEFLIYNQMLRIINNKNEIQNEVYSNRDLSTIPAQFTTRTRSEIIQTEESRSIMIRVPIVQDQEVIGTLEIGKKLFSLDYYGDILMKGLLIASGIALLLSLIGGYFYTRIVFKPINQLADTMQKIEQSGSFSKLELREEPHHTDELDKLGFIFNKMIGKLENNFHRQRQFIADASHELRTPLTIIESYASLLKRWASNDSELREEAIDAIYSESIRLKGLIKSLLSIAEGQEAKLELERFSLLSLAKDTIAPLRQTYGRSIIIKSEQTDIQLTADMERIKQLLIILLDNAIKYSDQEVIVLLDENEERVQLVIQDRGIGIKKEEIPLLFERFYRVDQARSRKTGGAGLGLSIAKRIVEQHDGEIEIKSELNVGTCIRVKIPNKGKKI